MPLPNITEEDLANVDLTKPLPVKSSPITDRVDSIDPNRVKMVMEWMGNPLEGQKFGVGEMRLALDMRMKRDIDEFGFLTDNTMDWMVKVNQQLSDLHRNMYGTKSTNLNLNTKITHSQVASLMRKARQENVVDAPLEKEEGGERNE